jgi:hypothetical protein
MTLVEEVKVLLGESAGSVFWTTDHIVDALNEALHETTASLKNNIITTPWIVEAGSDLVDIPSGIMIPKQIEDTSRVFFIITQAKLEQYSRGWRGAATGIPSHFVLWDAFKIRVWPMPDNDYQYNMVGIGWGTEFTSSVVDITGDFYLRKSLVCRAGASLFELTQPILSESLLRQALGYEQSYRTKIRNNQSHNLRRLHPGGNKTNSAKSGVIKLGRNFSL